MKPGDFLVGIQDFFAVVLPGALVMWIVEQYVPFADPSRMLVDKSELGEAAQWTAFLLGAYLIGNFVFMAGSRLDPMYDRWRRRKKPADADSTFKAADDLRTKLTPRLSGGEFTTLKWAKSYIQIHSPGARIEIERFEATSKFFRSMIVVSVALFAHFLFHEGYLGVALLMVFLGLLSYERFRDQRWKATELAYGTAVILHETKGRADAKSPAAASNDGNE